MYFGSFLCALLLGGCAQPKYAQIQINASSGNSKESLLTCIATFSLSKNCLSLKWEAAATEQVFGVMLFQITRANLADGSPVLVDAESEPEPPTVLIDMPTMTHNTPPIEVTHLDLGTYRASNIFFAMHGSWEIRVRILSKSGGVDEAVVPFVF